MNKVKIVVSDINNSFIKYLIGNNINYSNLYFNKKYYLVVDYDSYKRISRRYETVIVEYYGKMRIKLFFYKNKYFLISFIFCVVLLNLLLNTIFRIEINAEGKLLSELNVILEHYDVKKYKRIKSSTELLNIKKKILSDYSDKIKWIEFTRKGCTYIVDVTPNIVVKKEEELKGCFDVVAKRDGMIKHISSSNGVKLKSVNDYVKKDDVLISGTIYKGEDIYSDGGASGKVMAETWYSIKVSVPYEYTNFVPTGEVINRYYVKLFDKEITLIGYYKSDEVFSEHELVLDKPYLFFKLYRENIKKYKYVTNKLTVDDAYNLAIKKAHDEIDKLLDNDEYVISKKVLKKEEKSSKIYVEVFFKILENIGVTSNRSCLGELDEVSNKRSN